METTPFDARSPNRAALAAAVAGVVECEREERRIQARKAVFLAEVEAAAAEESERYGSDARGSEMPYRSAGIDTGRALGVSWQAANRRIEHAARLTDQYPLVHEALEGARLTLEHTRAIVHHGIVITDDAARAGYEAEILELAVVRSSGETWKLARLIAAKYTDHTFEERHAEANAFRSVSVIDSDDGMAEVRILTDAGSAYAVKNRVWQMSRKVQDAELAAVKAWREARRVQDAAGADAGDGRDEGNAAADDLGGAGLGGAGGTDSGDAGVVDLGGAGDGADSGCPVVRPIGQTRSDLAVSLLLDGEPSNDEGLLDLSDVRAKVQVTVPVLTLLTGPEELGTSDSMNTDNSMNTDGSMSADGSGGARYLRIAGLQGAAVLAGYGPIGAATARMFAGLSKGWDRISCHPETGQVITVDRYRPSEEIKRFVLARDQECRWPGCTRVPHESDLDHTIDAALGGTTSTENLSVECRVDHVNKHRTGMRMRQLPGGVIEWTTPLGSTIREEPRSMVQFRPVIGDTGEGSALRAHRRRRGSRVRFADGDPASPRGRPTGSAESAAERDEGPVPF